MSFENCFYEISMVFNNIINTYFVHYYEQSAVRLDSVLLYCYGMPPFRNVVMPEETETGQKCERSVELLQGRNYLDAMFLDGRFRDIGPCFEKKPWTIPVGFYYIQASLVSAGILYKICPDPIERNKMNSLMHGSKI